MDCWLTKHGVQAASGLLKLHNKKKNYRQKYVRLPAYLHSYLRNEESTPQILTLSPCPISGSDNQEPRHWFVMKIRFNSVETSGECLRDRTTLRSWKDSDHAKASIPNCFQKLAQVFEPQDHRLTPAAPYCGASCRSG